MAKGKTEPPIAQSLIDRLSGVEVAPANRAESVLRFRESLKRDVEWLFNSRQPPMLQLEAYPEAAASVLNYGLPDSHGSIAADSNGGSVLTAAILQCLCVFEPRLRQPRVMLARSEPSSRRLRFHIEGEILLGATVEEMAFDTVLDQITGEYEVE